MSSSRVTTTQQCSGDIVKQGSLKKLKTMRKKYFVLRGDSGDSASQACIEYYDSERKFKNNQPPKRSITLKTCFNINKRTDTRHKWVIALYTKKDCFSIVLDTEEEMEEWLKALLELQLGEAIPEGEPVRPNFEHVWRVTVLSKELGSKKNILGPYLLCLTDQSLSLVKATNEDRYDHIEFSLQKIRRCGSFDTFFYMELGQCTVTGPGNLWMQTEDTNIAENMHTTILNAFTNCQKGTKDLQPKSRTRSSSANEASKPISLIQRFTHPGGLVSVGNHQRTCSFPLSPVPPVRRASTGTRPNKHFSSHFWMSNCRERSDSMPSRPRTTSEGAHIGHAGIGIGMGQILAPPSSAIRPHSMYNRGISYSPPVNSSPLSPGSGACSTDSAGSSLSMDGMDIGDGPWEDQVILEENSDDYAPWPGEDEKLNNYMKMEPSYSHSHSLSIQGNSCLNRKHSPNPSSSGFKSSSPSQGSTMDMYSPCSSSPLDTSANYMPMSPGDNSRYLRNTMESQSHSHSRGSSLTEDGYVPMAPAASDDGYVDMGYTTNQNKHGSCGSITPGTPSTDIRFSDYTLDKVSTYFSPDEITPTERPTRAYSVGSRPSPNLNRCEPLNASMTCERVRAFSVGSRSQRVFGVGVGGIGVGRIPPSSSHSSMEPCDDMMELDFSKKGRRARKKATGSSSGSIHQQNSSSASAERLHPGIPMGPGTASAVSSPASSYSTAEGSSYMEMSPPRKSYARSPPKCSPPGHPSPSPSLSRVPEGGEYRPVPPDASGASYMEMKPGETKHIVARNTKIRIDSFPVQRSSPPIKPALLSRSTDDYLDMSLKRKMSLTEDNNNTKVMAPQMDEYVEMTLGAGAKGEQIRLAKESGDYMVMNLSNSCSTGSTGSSTSTSSSKATVSMRTRAGRTDRSQPIAIQGSGGKEGGVPVRKHSTGTPPKGPLYLSLSHNSSRWGHKKRDDSASGIFPFSPEAHEPQPSSKCSVDVDGTSGELKIYKEEDKEEEEEDAPMDRLLTGLGTMTILAAPTNSLSPNAGKELHYASVELVRRESDGQTYGHHQKLQVGGSCSSQSHTLPKAVQGDHQQQFTYAQIDFVKSQQHNNH